MSAPNTIIVAGNLTAAPIYRMTSSEIPFVRLRLAVNRRAFVAESNSWEDRTDGFFSVTAWRDLAVHAHQSLRKGDRVVVHGRLTHRQYEVATGEGTSESREATEIEADELGASLRWTAWSRVEKRPLNEGEPTPVGTRSPSATDAAEPSVQADPVEDAEEDVAAAA